MQMIKYQLVFHYRNCTNRYMMLDSKILKIRSWENIQGLDEQGPATVVICCN